VSPSTYLFLSIDLPAMLAGTLAAMTCALLGNFLVLRRQSLMGDAISHAVLPGIVVGFLIAGTRRTLPIFIGAGVSAMLTVLMISALRRVARVEPGAAMGVSFSILFALGVLLIEQAAARHVDLDADCVLYGQLEYINWTPPEAWSELLSRATWASLPRQVVVLFGALVLVCAFVLAFYKELRLTTFDPAHASAIGFSAPRLNAALMVLVAGATVAAFEAVGSILVIAMLITPPATARLLTDRYAVQLLLSLVLAGVTGVLGYLAGAFLPDALGLEGGSLNAAGAMTVVGVLILLIVIVFAPTHGVLARARRRRALACQMARDDVLALLYRLEESRPDHAMLASRLEALIGAAAGRPVRTLARDGLVRVEGGQVSLTDEGRQLAQGLIRSHRLWESWLVQELGLRPDHVHQTAERLEHLQDKGRPLRPAPDAASTDPHNRPIPDPTGNDASG
jgi:manganese/zinc/iron transport system permease protein